MALRSGPAVHVPVLELYTALWVSAFVVHFVGGNWVLTPAPATNVLPPGVSFCGPISTIGNGSTGLPLLARFPANDQDRVAGVNSWVLPGIQVWTVRSLPFGSRVQPSSSLG